ncbi:MAG: flagellar hook-length control protein FliK [Deltaproteobacteria bacterium]|jgi:hypothetical protein|nr:flagellar hook-length control protein FliK [Deltaproteobacteria bacterium]
MSDILNAQAVYGDSLTERSLSSRDLFSNFEEGAHGDFQRILESAESHRRETAKDLRRHAEDEKAHLRDETRARERRREADKAGEDEADASAAERVEEEDAESRGAKEADDPLAGPGFYKFKADRKRGRMLSYATLNAEMNLPGGFKRRLSSSLILTGVPESGKNGLALVDGQSPVSILKDALEALNTSAELGSLDKDALGSISNILLESGVSQEETERLLSGLVGEDGRIQMKDLVKVLSQAQDWLAVNGQTAVTEGLTATGDGLNSLGQFLMGLGLSPETIKAVTSDMEIGAIIQVGTLQEIISEGGLANLNKSISEGDLSFLALALQSMGADRSALGGLDSLLRENKGQVPLSSLLDFLKTLEKPGLQTDAGAVLSDLQNVIRKVESSVEMTKPPVFNEILLKLSLLGDRELDKNFFELSPALQALRGGLSGIRGDSASQGDFNSQGGNQGEDRREREERRMIARSAYPGAASGTVAGAFSGSLYEEVAGYSASDSLARQLGQKLVYSSRRGVKFLKMNLAPESLGELAIELKVRGKTVTANIQADSLEAYQALEKEVLALKAELASAGLDLKLTLNYQGEAGAEKFFPGGKEGYASLEGGSGEEEGAPNGEEGESLPGLEEYYGGSLLNTLV